jgi:hypothetical protein
MSVNWRYGGDKIFIVYGIHKMWFSEFSAPAQTPPTEKAKDTPVTKKSVKGRDSNIENKLIGLKSLLDKGLITQEDYDRKKAELLDQL